LTYFNKRLILSTQTQYQSLATNSCCPSSL